MKTLLSYLFLLLTLLGCVQSSSGTRKSTVSSSSTTTTSTPTTPTFASDENLYWFNTTKILGTVTINKNTADVIYLRGKLVHNFLTAKDTAGIDYYKKQYCLVGSFSATSYKQVRVRAVPISLITSTKATERLLRVDVPSSNDNSSACNNTTIDTVLPANAAFSLPEICSTCTGQITTSALNLYESKVTTPVSLTLIDAAKINLSSVLIRVDLSSSSTNASGSCTNSSCSAKGFDCCISGQCAQDGTERPNLTHDSAYYQATTDYAANPLSFINYPNVYYVCSNISHVPPATSTNTSTPLSLAQARVAKYLADYQCTVEASTSSTYLTCRNLDSNGAATAIDKLLGAYTAIKKKLAVACGCTASDADMAVKCPDWGIIPVYLAGAAKTDANITDFSCYTPAAAEQVGAITSLNVNVPNRSAPHRFYSSTGVNFDSLTGVTSKYPTMVQENGNTNSTDEDFHYLDDYNKLGPVNGSYNINSVLGQMSVDLSHTMPAKQVTVEYGKSYIISATSGYFTPCSQCAKDSWFQAFSAHPNTQKGLGLQASGYTTSRDTYSANSTYGNYEDTKFGRACYVPVTMLPLAHQKNSNIDTQRKNRLRTQAAYYINGYQRDWYGFNKGALIGSFDGVTWFAVGSGRRATATSTKLYLAINGAFLDLADRTDTIVNIIPDLSVNVAADYDYNPDISATDSHQNAGASCQQYHQCSTDTDCVTQLGWEYTCADVSQLKTKWPQFDTDAKETVNQEKTDSIFNLILNPLNTTSTKRCVYRGQGAPCKLDYTTLNDNLKKGLTCAPNFYCASMTLPRFNDELVRSPNEYDDILYGMDANVLGRPLKYVTASKSLTSEIISNLKYNAANAMGIADSDGMGICRPGRSLASSDPRSAHMNPDNSKRADYISQIGSCDSTASTSARYYSCPAFDDTLNYVSTNTAADLTLRETQNACGGEAKHTTSSVSAFKAIDGLSLLNSQTITSPVLALDACFRRAGSVCHTDLDCGPNKMHEDSAGSVDLKYFGETLAEQKYWQESLVCGQGDAIPALGTNAYASYKLNENRCCREIGKDFTMYTQGLKSVVPDNVGSNEKLITSRFPDKNPAAQYRYSRYTISKEAVTPATAYKIPAVPDPLTAVIKEPAQKQWQVINETGSLTCCGGGWIRKFADGTHDWKVRNRLTLQASNFSCLNFRSPLADSSYSAYTTDLINQTSYQREYEYFCKSPGEKGCFQIEYPTSNEFVITSPLPYSPEQSVVVDSVGPAAFAGLARIDTTPIVASDSTFTQSMNVDSPYLPIAFNFPNNDTQNPDTKKAENYFFVTSANATQYPGVSFYLPSYVRYDGSVDDSSVISSVYIKYVYPYPTSPQSTYVAATAAPAGECANVVNITHTAVAGVLPAPVSEITGSNKYCVVSNAKTGNRPVFIAKAATGGAPAWTAAGVIINYITVEKSKGTKVAVPGNALYYLSKLAKFELLGIPQITYEPLYCNNDQTKLVPGLFKGLTTRAGFTASGYSYTGVDPISRYESSTATKTDVTANYGNFEQKFTYQDQVDHPAVFSANDFTCCTPLGKETTSATRCCSGAATSADGKIYTCKLPKGTDLNVYFNKFVSSEGVGDDQPGGGLTIKDVASTGATEDFNPYTGEPKYRTATYDKLKALGDAYCDGKNVQVGGAFGNFPPEPFSGTYNTSSSSSGSLESSFPLSIVDSVLDFQASDPNLGKQPFDLGFRWNHHLYCK